MTQTDIGLIGLAVMGQNLVLNMTDHGYTVSVFNRTLSTLDDFMAGPAKGHAVHATHTIEAFVQSIRRPRRILLMVKAGAPVDEWIQKLLPILDQGDIIIDGGNSNFEDTERRCREVRAKGIYFLGAGISGGESGARHGPSIMPGGNPEAWPFVKEIFQNIAAKVGKGEPCCDWVGEGGAGHYVKMVHNGIEYGDMQLIGEAYAILSQLLATSAQEMAELFAAWNERELQSYLIEITSHIFRTYEPEGTLLVDNIVDAAGQKGTGKWTVTHALEAGVPVTLIAEAVFARYLSALRDERQVASKKLRGPGRSWKGDHNQMRDALFYALYASKIISYAQGYMLLRQAAAQYGWKLEYGRIALMWRGGCIIRSRFLDKIEAAFLRTPSLTNLLLDDFFSEELARCQEGWREVVAEAARGGVAIPCLSAALAFYDGYRTARLPANLLQAQRDYFGAHRYERTDRPRGEWFHTEWER